MQFRSCVGGVKTASGVLICGVFALLSGCQTSVSGSNGAFSLFFNVSDNYVERSTKTVPVADVSRVDVRTFAGDVDVVVDASRSEIVIELLREVNERDQATALALLDTIRFDFSVVEGTLTIRARDGVESVVPRGARASLKVTLPSSLPLEIRTDDGGIGVEGTEKPVSARTERGDISVTRHSGGLTVETDQGAIDLSDVKGDVRAITGGGNISALVTIDESGRIDLRTDAGTVTLEVPTNTKASIELTARRGEVTFDLESFTVNGLRVSQQFVEAELNGGGGVIRAETDSGAVVFNGL